MSDLGDTQGQGELQARVDQVAVIGLGDIGAPTSLRLADVGFDVVAYDPRDEVFDDLEKHGVSALQSVAECARADVVIVAVRTAEQVRSVVTGHDGLLSASARKPAPAIVVLSTVSPDLLTELDPTVSSAGGALIDAPVSGGSHRARAGELTVMLGGSDENVARVSPVLQGISRHILHCGAIGYGTRVKLVNNILCAGNTLLVAEAYRLALSNGISLETLLPAIDVSSGRNYLSIDPETARQHYADAASDIDSFRSVIALLSKDSSLASELTSNSDGEYPTLDSLIKNLNSVSTETFETWKAVGSPSM